MALGQAVDLFSRVMGNLFDVRVAALTFYLGMHTIVKNRLIDKKKPELTVFVNPAEAGILVAQKTIAHIGRVRINRDKKKERQE